MVKTKSAGAGTPGNSLDGGRLGGSEDQQMQYKKKIHLRNKLKNQKVAGRQIWRSTSKSRKMPNAQHSRLDAFRRRTLRVMNAYHGNGTWEQGDVQQVRPTGHESDFPGKRICAG